MFFTNVTMYRVDLNRDIGDHREPEPHDQQGHGMVGPGRKWKNPGPM